MAVPQRQERPAADGGPYRPKSDKDGGLKPACGRHGLRSYRGRFVIWQALRQVFRRLSHVLGFELDENAVEWLVGEIFRKVGAGESPADSLQAH